jgi:hypothetical protein
MTSNNPDATISPAGDRELVDIVVFFAANLLKIPVEPGWLPGISTSLAILMVHAEATATPYPTDDLLPAPVFKA